MPPTEKPKVKVKITGRFTYERTLFGPGEWEVAPATAHGLVAEGRATIVGEKAAKAPAKEPPKAPPANPRIPPAKEPEEEVTSTPLPEGFPCQATLAVAGYDSVESLRVDGIKEKLEAVEGLTPADVTKIGLAISKV